MGTLKVAIRLVFATKDAEGNIGRETKLGSFTNAMARRNENHNKVARLLVTNCSQEERSKLLGYIVDDETFDSIHPPREKVKQIYW